MTLPRALQAHFSFLVRGYPDQSGLATAGKLSRLASVSQPRYTLLAENKVDVLFTDIVMAGLNGIELAKRAKQQHPEIKIMFMTGYYSRAADAEPLGKLLFKPLRERQMIEELSGLLTAGDAA